MVSASESFSAEDWMYGNEYAEAHYERDLAGRETEVSYYDKEGKLVSVRRGYAKKTTAYNDLGNISEEAYFDADGNPVNSAMGYAKAVYTYDELGNLQSESYYDTKMLGVVPKDETYATLLVDRDEEGRPIREVYFDIYNNPVNNRDGYSERVLIKMGVEELDFVIDLREPFNVEGENATDIAKRTTATMVLHGAKEDVTVELGYGFFIDFLLITTMFTQINGLDYIEKTISTPVKMSEV